MSFTVARLLIHSDGIGAGTRDAVEAAYAAPPESRSAMMESAARTLHHETGLGCDDVREIFGLPDDYGCR
jgi:hypothetical protein